MGYLSDRVRPDALTSLKILLRAGASLDSIDGDRSAERMFRGSMDSWSAFKPSCQKASRCLDLVLAVRRAGSWRNYVLQPHRDILRLRSLRARGRARLLFP